MAAEHVDPLHQPGAAATHWTTINAEENLPGVVTPLSGSFWLRPISVGTLGAFVELGVLKEQDARFSDVIDERICSIMSGRFCANVDLLRKCADKTPGTSGDALEQQLFANVRPGQPKYSARGRYPVVAAKAPVAAARIASWVHREFARSQDWWSRSIAQAPSDDFEKAKLRLHGAQDHMARVLRPHTLGTFMTQGIFDQLTSLVESIGRADLLLEISRGLGSLEETDMLGHLWEVAQGRKDLSEFLAQYGFHGPGEAAASATVWREDPDMLKSVLETYRAMDEARSPQSIAAEVARKRNEATAELMSLLPAAKRPIARILLKLSDKYWPLRETGKATLLHSIDVARAASRRLGVLLAQEGRILQPEDVAYITVEELVADDGSTDWKPEVEFRRARREEYLKLEIPQSWDGSPVAVENGPASDHTSVELTGIGGSPGIAEGIVRVISNPLDDDLNDGEILVCETTDPSWASLFLVASALIIDVGSAMSHGAIVAREMGVPCVINTRTGTRELRTGDRVRVNGSTGHVEILARAEVAAAAKEQ